MTERMMGIETEYALAVMGPRGTPAARGSGVQALLDAARRTIPNLSPGNGFDLFLHNGSRLYVDCGMHPELSTGECLNPWDVVRYVKAGDRLLAGLLPDVVRAVPGVEEAFLFKCNVDYSGARTTWGCHESYLHRCQSDLSADLIPHFVSRIVYSGAGGFNPLAPGVEFTLSPRAFHMMTTVSGSSTEFRPIHHTREESLAKGDYRRLHVIAGESLASETALWLKVASTALVVAMIEAGVNPGRQVQLQDPVFAMKAFAADPLCKVHVTAADGRGISALDIQRHYLELAEARVDEKYMPPWAAKAVETWRAVLDSLENAPGAVSTRLDWAVKQALYMDHVRRRGFEWQTVTEWSRILARTMPQPTPSAGRGRSRAEILALRRRRIASPPREAPKPDEPTGGISQDEFTRLRKLRSELFEIDLRFAQVGDDSIFAHLDRSGVLEHHFEGVDHIEHAMEQPPDSGRARVRGEFVREHWKNENGRYSCYWDRILDRQDSRHLDLSDPFATNPRWANMPEPPGPRLRQRRRPGDSPIPNIFGM